LTECEALVKTNRAIKPILLREHIVAIFAVEISTAQQYTHQSKTSHNAWYSGRLWHRRRVIAIAKGEWNGSRRQKT
jgi:hypothetical protein